MPPPLCPDSDTARSDGPNQGVRHDSASRIPQCLVPRHHKLAGLDKRRELATLAEYPLVTYLFSDRPESSLMSSFTSRDADVIKTYVRMGLGVLASMAVEAGADDDLIAIDASGLFPRLTTWIGFDDDLPLKPSHRAFIQLLAPHLSDRQIDGDLDRADVDPDGAELPLRGGPVAPLEMRGC